MSRDTLANPPPPYVTFGGIFTNPPPPPLSVTYYLNGPQYQIQLYFQEAPPTIMGAKNRR